MRDAGDVLLGAEIDSACDSRVQNVDLGLIVAA